MSAERQSELLAAAHRPVPDDLRCEVTDHARRVALLAVVDALEHPDDQRGVAQAARVLLQGASAARVDALAEALPARHAHALVEALTRHGQITPRVARDAHLRIDVRLAATMRARNESGPATLERPGPWP